MRAAGLALGDVGLALRLLRRDHAAGELRLLLLALVIAIASTTLIQSFAQRLERGMTSRAADVMGGDLVVTGASPLPADWEAEAVRLGLAVSRSAEFSTVALRDDALQLSSVKAVDAAYPLRGSVRTSAIPFVEGDTTEGGPAPGTVWIEARLLTALGVTLGDGIEIGDATLRVAAIITAESDRGASFYSFSPRIMMAMADLASTAVVQPGSRVSWRLAVAGDSQSVTAFRTWLQPRISVHEKLQDTVNDRPELSGAMSRASAYLSLAGMMAVVLAGVAIALATRRYSERHRDMVAMLRCLGTTQSRLMCLFLVQIAVIGLVGASVGGVVGLLGQQVLVLLLQSLLPTTLPPAGVAPLLMGAGTGMLMLAGFALPPLLALRHTPPLRVLRRDAEPPSAPAMVIHGIALVALTVMILQFTGDATLTLRVVTGGVVAAALFSLVARLMLRWAAGIESGLAGRTGRSGRGELAWRMALRRLTRERSASTLQLLGFGMTFMAMSLLVLLRTDLVDAWVRQVPSDAPNHFAINVMPEDVAAFEAFLDQRNIPRAEVFPMVRGRLVAINGQSVGQHVSKEDKTPGSAERELNLTWSASTGDDNAVSEGQWWEALPAPTAGGPAQVSVESKLAARLSIGVGDQLRFSVGGIPVESVVTSLRDVHWDSFRPNFYMIFRPGSLDHVPATYMTSFHLDAARKPLLNDLVHAFRSVTVLEVDGMLRQVRDILTQVTLAIEFILAFALAAGVTVLWASVQASLPARCQEAALLRTLGAGRGLVNKSLSLEFLSLGVIAGLLGALGAQGLLAVLNIGVFDLPFVPNLWVLVVVPLLAGVLVCGAGLAGARRVADTPPVVTLRES
jgi:putative ABC transport system permease protein